MAAIAPFLPAIASLGASAISGIMGKPKETRTQGIQRELIDQILASIKGQGPFSNMFNMDEQAFNKSYVEPAKQMFQSQIAPQIQQSYIASGQQRGTGMEDALTRAGVDLDKILNQQYSQMQENAMNRQLGAMGGILSQPAGTPQTSNWQAMGQGLVGGLSSKAFGKEMTNIMDYFKDKDKEKNKEFAG